MQRVREVEKEREHETWRELVNGYTHITHANGDAALRRGWREYLADRMPRLEAELPGISAAVRARAQEMR